MHHIVLDRWSRGHSFLHARDARAKIAALLAFLVAVATTGNGSYRLLAGYGGLLLAGLLIARLPVLSALWRGALILPFSATFAVASWLSGDSVRAVTLIEKNYLSALAVLLLVSTTPLPRLMRGLEALRAPGVLVLVIQFLYRYLFVISEQAQHMLLASRCRAPRRSGARGGKSRFQAAAGALAVLFARSYRRAQGIQNAMAARGFTGQFPSSTGGRFSPADALFLTAAFVSTAVLRFGMAAR